MGNTEVAVLQTVFVISYIIFAPLIGYFGDKFNRKWILIMGILLQMTAILAGSFVVDSFNQLLLTRIALGIAECILNVVCFPFVSDLYPASSRSMVIQVRTQCKLLCIPQASDHLHLDANRLRTWLHSGQLGGGSLWRLAVCIACDAHFLGCDW